MDWRIDYYEAKYHLAVAERMFQTYNDYPEKKILVGAIKELSKSAEKIIRTFLIKDNTRGGIKIFAEKVAPKYMDKTTLENIIKIQKIKKFHENAKVEFIKKGHILFFTENKWTILKLSRLKQFTISLKDVIENFRQI